MKAGDMRRYLINYKLFVALFLWTILPYCSSSSKHAEIDTDFGSSGKVTVDFSSAQDEVFDLSIRDGKIFLLGKTSTTTTADFAIAKLDENGTLDSSFDSDGLVTIDFDSGLDEARSFVFDSDGNLYIAGSSSLGAISRFAIAKVNSSGTLDTGFDSDGRVTTLIGSSLDIAHAIGLQSDKKIIVGGSSKSGSQTKFAIARYKTDGSLDTDFGSTGKIVTAVGSTEDQIENIKLLSNDTIIAIGQSKNMGKGDFALMRFEKNGAIDTAFGSSGKTTTDFGEFGNSPTDDYLTDAEIHSDGKIITVGYSSDATYEKIALARYTDSGVLDSTFGNSGKTTANYKVKDSQGNSVTYDIRARSIAIASDGSYFVTGVVTLAGGTDVILAHFLNTGLLDTSFGEDGFVRTDIDSLPNEGSAIGIQSDGKIIVAGKHYNTNQNDFLALRYYP